MLKFLPLAALAVVLSAAPSRAAILAQSSFDAGAEGWSYVTADGTVSGWPIQVTGSVDHNAAGGNPGGFIDVSDVDAFWTLFRAPAAFAGNQEAAYGGALAFDLISLSQPGINYDDADVILKGAGLTLVADVTSMQPPTTWTSYSVNLTAGVWRLGNILSGALATEAQIRAVLAGLTELWISAEHVNGITENIGLDNVVLRAPGDGGEVTEPATLALLGVGLLGLAAVRRKQRTGGR
jgi:hypothetical protein